MIAIARLYIEVRGFRFWFIVSILAICILSSVCYAQAVSSTELIANAKKYDCVTVVYEGEVIGDIMVRGKFAWINVNDGRAAIGVWVEKDLIRNILHTGNYKTNGSWIRVNGVFKRACPEHGGDLDIHAKTIKVLRSGSIREESIPPFKVRLIIILFVICLVTVIIYFIRLVYGKGS